MALVWTNSSASTVVLSICNPRIHVSWACLIGTLVLARSRTGPATSITSSRDLLSRNLGRLDGAGWPAASFRFEHADDESSSRREAAQMATLEQRALSDADFCSDPIVRSEAASSRADTCLVSAHCRALASWVWDARGTENGGLWQRGVPVRLRSIGSDDPWLGGRGGWWLWLGSWDVVGCQ
jgi:hypothetical protein